MLDLRWIMWSFYFPRKNICVQFEGMFYQKIVGILVGTNCAPLIAELFFFFCYERDFKSNLLKSKQYGQVIYTC